MELDYTQFKLDADEALFEIRQKCMTEMYKRAQPSADYKQIYENYKTNNERIYDRYYLSEEEFRYVLNKYIESYHLDDKFAEACDVLVKDLQKGYTTDKYIPVYTDVNGDYHPGYRDYESKPSFNEVIGKENTNKVVDFIKDRKSFYRFGSRRLSQFSFSISLGDSPTSNINTVKEYWKSQGVDLVIDPRHLTEDEFWCEENGIDPNEE